MTTRNAPLPKWFTRTDFGIFIHWGPYSVPAFAPTDVGDFGTIVKHHSLRYLYANQPYAEWYLNGMRTRGSAVTRYHQEYYGNRTYLDLVDDFKAAARNVDVDAWADQFAAAGAQYVVVVTKHHDGFVMYDSNVRNPKRPDYHLDFDFVGQLAQAVRSRGMRFGVYYSSLLDWTFQTRPIRDAGDLVLGYDTSPTYLNYVWDQWHELIDRYHPDILWNDIGYPTDKRLPELFAYFYEAVPQGVINDRWNSYPNWLHNPLGRAAIDLGSRYLQRRESKGGAGIPPAHYDYRTLEYNTDWQGGDDYFEVTRGIDKSFGYNRMSRPEDSITADQVRALIKQVTPQKGRLLLNVGPMADGQLPPQQAALLSELETTQN